MNISTDFSGFLSALYASTADRAGWRAIATRAANEIGAHSCQIGIWSPQAGGSRRLSWTANYTPELNDAYQARYHRHDPWVAWVNRISRGGLVTGDAISIDPQFMQTEIYNDYCRRLGIFHVVGAGIARRANGSSSIIGLHREERYGPFDERQKQRLRAMLPHFRQALALRERFDQVNFERDALLRGLESLRVGAIIVDRSGALLFAGATAESILRTQSQLYVRDGHVHLADARQGSMMLKFIGDAARTGGGQPDGAGGLMTVLLGVAEKLWVRVCPLPIGVLPELALPAAVLFLCQSNSPRIPLQAWLMSLYRLTRTEARLAEAFANGASLAEYSQSAGVSLNTAKTLSKRVYAKTGHHSRAQFIRDVLKNPFLEH